MPKKPAPRPTNFGAVLGRAQALDRRRQEQISQQRDIINRLLEQRNSVLTLVENIEAGTLSESTTPRQIAALLRQAIAETKQ